MQQSTIHLLHPWRLIIRSPTGCYRLSVAQRGSPHRILWFSASFSAILIIDHYLAR